MRETVLVMVLMSADPLSETSHSLVAAIAAVTDLQTPGSAT